jgi:hypothetical protein
MNLNLANRLLIVCSILFLLVAFVVALRVIPAVGSDISPNAVPERAVPPFWVNVGLSVLLALSCGAVAFWSKGRDRISTTILVVLGIVALLLGLALMDAASAFRSHEMLAQGTSKFLYLCAAVDLLSGALVIVVGYRRPRVV